MFLVKKLEQNPELIKMLESDITQGKPISTFGRQDTTVIETNIHYPTNNSLVWDCIKESERLLGHLKEEIEGFSFKEIYKESVPVKEKIFSIYERHTDIIVKGQRDVQFGHKVNLGSGKSNLILTCEILKGNPKDSGLYQDTIEKVKKYYGKTPESSTADGGFASRENIEYSKKEGIVNIVFNKIRGCMQNIADNKWIENKLKRWRSGIEAVISNLKRGFHISRCVWKGIAHYGEKVFWSVIGYNLRVITAGLLAGMTL